MKWLVGGALLSLQLSAPQAASAQIAERVGDVERGVVRFSYETRPGVEICDQGVRIGDRRMWWRSYGGHDSDTNCGFRPAEVELDVRRGVVRDVEIVTARRGRATEAVDVGPVTPEVAVRYLLELARRGEDADGAEHAVFPAMLADVADVWRDLLDIARDRGVRGGVRENALFWVGQEAAEAATAGLHEVAIDPDEEQDVRNAAVFALSQRSPDEAVPILIEVATTSEEAETRRKAMFWLAQLDDERVVDFFEDILLGRIR